MSLFWFSIFGLLLLASGFIILPLWRSARDSGGSPGDQAESNLRLHEERRHELAQSLIAGDITQAEHDAQVEDHSIVLLEDAESLLGEAKKIESPAGTTSTSKQVLGISVCFLSLISIVWYSDFGWSQGSLTELEFAERLQENGDAPRSKANLEDLASALKQVHDLSPDNEQVGFYLGQLYLTLGNFERATATFGPLSARYPEDGDLAVALAESRYLQDGRQLSDDLAVLFDRAVRLRPNSVSLLEILGMEAFKRGDNLGAKAFFERALAYADGERAKLILTVLEGLPESANRVRVKPETVAPIEVKPALTTREVVVTVTADPALTLKPNATIYVFAKAVSGPPMPLAVVKHKASELPLQVVLDESMSMMAGLSIAEFDRIIVTAKISESGLATSSQDDLVTESAPLEFDQNKIKVSLVLRAGI